MVFIDNDTENDLRLSDIIDVKFLQDTQDAFSDAVNIASVIIDKYGQITTPSIGNDFCYKFTRGTSIGNARCNKCGLEHEKIAFEQGKPQIYHCHTGLIDFVVPIVVNGKMIARIMCGQVLDEEPDEEKFRVIARELGIDEDEYISALRKIKVFPKKHIEAAAKLLFSTGNIIAEMAEKNLRLRTLNEKAKKVIKNEKFLHEIISAYIQNSDVDKLYSFLLYKTSKLFNADRGIFVIQNSNLDNEQVIADYQEFLAYPSVPSLSKNMPSNALIKRLLKMLLGHQIIYGDTATSDIPMSKEMKNLLKELRIKSFINVPIYYGETTYGCIILHYVNHEKHFSEDDITLLKSIAGQTAAVINQATLYSSIKKNEEYTQKVISNIQDAVITTDEDFQIQTCNEAVAELWGYEPSDCIGKNIKLLINYDDSIKDSDKYIYLLGNKKMGGTFDAEVTVRAVNDDNENKIILFVIKDITERRAVERLKNEFVSTVSHELRTPLTSIRGALGLIMSGKIGEVPLKIKSLIDIADKNSLRLINLINDILDIEKIEAGKMKFEIINSDLVLLINKAIAFNLQYAQKFNVKLDFMDSLTSAIVNVDEDRLIQVITNLISNAVKFSKPDSSVLIETKRLNSGHVKVEVTNFGVEISEEFKKRIFQKFAQADASDSRKKGGTGLGLSISKSIIEKLGGEIGFDSKDNKTTFYFMLPEVV